MTRILETTHNSVLCKTLSFISVLSADTQILINKWINKCTESKLLASKGRMKTISFKCQIKVAIEIAIHIYPGFTLFCMLHSRLCRHHLI